MDIAKKQFASQLREAMVAAGFDPKPAVLEREFNTRHWGKPMTLHGVRLWLLGKTMPDFNKMETLSKWLGVSVHQLSYGGPSGRKVEQQRARWDSGIGYQDRDIFEAFLKLPIPQRKLIREVILTFAKVHEAQADSAGNSQG